MIQKATNEKHANREGGILARVLTAICNSGGVDDEISFADILTRDVSITIAIAGIGRLQTMIPSAASLSLAAGVAVALRGGIVRLPRATAEGGCRCHHQGILSG